ncbi:hypothetical protein J7S33_04160, partial [Saccharothrix algeriensis]
MTRNTRATGRAVALGLAALTLPVLPAAPAQAEPTGAAWSADLSVVDSDDVNVAVRGDALTLRDPAWRPAEGAGQGYLLSAERTVDRPVDRITARTLAEVPAGAAVEVDVRGRTAGGGWT